METNDGKSKEEIIANVKIWLDLVEQGLGRKPIIFSTQYFLQDNFSEADGGPPTWAKDYPLWLAEYPDKYSDDLQPSLPNGWPTWTFWMYTDKATVDGISDRDSNNTHLLYVDMNVFNGSIEDLHQFSGDH